MSQCMLTADETAQGNVMQTAQNGFNDRVFAVFDRLISSNSSFDWHTIMQEVKADKIPVKNWMRVRNVLQGFINRGALVRSSDTRVEEYVVQRVKDN